jgi:16S rRNA (guanine527-N7)-methyltransferase
MMAASLGDHAAALFGITLAPEQLALFDAYTRELAAWNAHTNLTAITDPDEVMVRHYLDSLSVAQAVPLAAGVRLIDVGSGAGFPGLPLLIAFPGLQVTLLEATGKKIAFLDHLIAALGLAGAVTLRARAEEAGQMPAQRAAYDVVVARAVARLPALLEYLLPLAKVGGRCIAMKGVTAETEARDSARALKTLGGALRGIEPVALPGVSEPHFLVVVDKVAPTPPAYPRRPGLPAHSPLV